MEFRLEKIVANDLTLEELYATLGVGYFSQLRYYKGVVMNITKKGRVVPCETLVNTASLAVVYTSGSERHPEYHALLTVNNSDDSQNSVLVFPSTVIPPTCFGIACLRQNMPEELRESVWCICQRLVQRYYGQEASNIAFAMVYISSACAATLFRSHMEDKGYRWVSLHPAHVQHMRATLRIHGMAISQATLDALSVVAETCQS